MAAKLKFMVKDQRKRGKGSWLYKRQFADGSWMNDSFKTADLDEALELYPIWHDSAERKARRIALLHKYADPEQAKTLRRDKFWNALARFLIAQRAANGGRLPRPPRVELPTAMRLASHPFVFVRSNFLAWAEDNDPEAKVVFELGDAREETLFHAGIVAAYFTVSEMERMEAKPVPKPKRRKP